MVNISSLDDPNHFHFMDGLFNANYNISISDNSIILDISINPLYDSYSWDGRYVGDTIETGRFGFGYVSAPMIAYIDNIILTGNRVSIPNPLITNIGSISSLSSFITTYGLPNSRRVPDSDSYFSGISYEWFEGCLRGTWKVITIGTHTQTAISPFNLCKVKLDLNPFINKINPGKHIIKLSILKVGYEFDDGESSNEIAHDALQDISLGRNIANSWPENFLVLNLNCSVEVTGTDEHGNDIKEITINTYSIENQPPTIIPIITSTDGEIPLEEQPATPCPECPTYGITRTILPFIAGVSIGGIYYLYKKHKRLI